MTDKCYAASTVEDLAVACGLQHATCSSSCHHDPTAGHSDDSASESSLSAEEGEAIQGVRRSPVVDGRDELLREAEQHASEYFFLFFRGQC